MRILAIDGGGIRGYYAAHILRRVKESFGTEFHNEFDLIAGTSTGSIIAAALAVGIPIERVCSLYEVHGHEIFKPARLSLGGMLKPSYSQRTLKRILEQEFGELTLKDAKTRLIIPSTDIGNGQVHVFKSTYSDDFKRDGRVKVADAVLASCSAPKYFRPAYIDPYLLADGGLWANNPSLVAVTETLTRLDVSKDTIRLLSVGTGIGKNYYSLARTNSLWGFLTGWGLRRFIEMFLNLQSIHSHNVVSLLLSGEQFVRINFEIDRSLPLDDPNMLPDLKSRADRGFTTASADIERLLRGSHEA